MKVLVAGATGAIGRPLIRCLKESGHAVFGLGRSSDSESALVEMGAEAEPSMRSMPPPLGPRFNGFDRMPSSMS